MRMEHAGCTRKVFAADAVVLLHQLTVGAMHDLDRLAPPRSEKLLAKKLVESATSSLRHRDKRERDR